MSGLLLGIAELSLRVFAPQTVQVEVLDVGSLGAPDPILGHRLRPGSRTLRRGPEFSYEAVVNEQGFRDAVLHAPEKPEGRTRIVLVGDSFTFGDANDYDDIWPVVFEANLEGRGCAVEVIKAGVPGWGTREEVLYLEELLDRFDPDYAILTLVQHDVVGARPVDSSAPHSQDGALDGKRKWHLVEGLRRLLMQNDDLFVSRVARGGSAPSYSFPFTESMLSNLEVIRASLSRAAENAKRSGTAFAVLSMPQEFQVVAGARELAFEAIDVHAIDRALLDFAEANGFGYWAALPSLEAAYARDSVALYHRHDGHLNQRGNRIVGDALSAAFLAAHGRPPQGCP